MIRSRSAVITATTVFTLSVGLAFVYQGRTAAQSTPGTTAQSGSARVPSTDRAFMSKAAQGGLAEVQLGQLATQQGSSDAVKQFGQRMVDDHTHANNELMQVALQKQITLPKSLSKKDQNVKTRLSKLSGAAFDRAYMADMVKDHQLDIADFQKEADSGQDPDVKAFAAKTLPTLKEHLTMAESVRAGKGMPDQSGASGTNN